MPFSRRGCCVLSAAVAGLLYAGASFAGVQNAQPGIEAKKPSLSLKITPPVGFAPLKTRLVVDVRNGDDDFADTNEQLTLAPSSSAPFPPIELGRPANGKVTVATRNTLYPDPIP